MRLIYHLVSRALWEAEPSSAFRAPSLAAEGFIHCSFEDQVVPIANCFLADVPDLVAVAIDVSKLTSAVKEEPVGPNEKFPHVYGPIDRAAVVVIRPLQRGPDGRWARIAS
jgi:uncharacterized protein (DUF952 family)